MMTEELMMTESIEIFEDEKFRIFNSKEKKNSFPSAFSVLGNRLYFSTIYNNLLYEFDLNTNKHKEYVIPTNNSPIPPLYRKAFVYKEKVFFIPENATHFLIIIDGRLFSMKSNGNYSDSALINDRLYLLDRERECVDVLNMNTFCYINTLVLPKQRGDGANYINLMTDGKTIYVTTDAEKQLYEINLETGYKGWKKTDSIVCYGVPHEGKIYYTATKKDLDGIYSLDVESGCSKKEASIDYDKSIPIHYYRFWNPQKIGEYIFFCPHEESKIIRYSLKTNEVVYIDEFSTGIRSLRPNDHKAVYGIDFFKDKLIVIPYYGDGISILSMEGKVCKMFKTMVGKRQIYDYITTYMEENETNVIDEGILSLDEYIYGVLGEID